MQWHCEDHSLRNAQPSWPILDDTALALVVNGAPHARLLTEESELADSMSSQRLMDFTSGRHSAHIAQRLLGLEEQPILRVNRSPSGRRANVEVSATVESGHSPACRRSSAVLV